MIYCCSKCSTCSICCIREFLGAWLVVIRNNFCGEWVLWRASCLNANVLSPPLISPLFWTITYLSRFVKMKRPVIFRCCESHFSDLQCVQLKTEILTSRLPASSLSGSSMQMHWEDIWKKTITHTALVLSWLLHHFYTHIWHLNCCFWLHYCAMVTICYFW